MKLLGDRELLKILKGLDKKTGYKITKRVLSDSANIYVKAAKANVPVRRTKLVPPPVKPGKKRGQWHPPGTGKKSPTKKMGRNRKSPTIFVGPRTGGDRRKDAWYLKFWERGTSKMSGRWGFKRAYVQNEKKVENNIFNSMRKIFEKEIHKHAKR